EALAEVGGICVSGKVHDEVHRKLDFAFEDIGEHRLKNIPMPVRVYRVRAAGAGVAARAAESAAAAGAGASALPPPGAPARPAKPSIIVLPFTNMSGVAEQEFFVDGLTEDILTELSR